MQISTDTLQFLKKLKKNNTREWFNKHKPEYKRHLQELKHFYEALEAAMQQHDTIENYKIFRIYRDVRFSKDKTPFKPRFAGYLTRATQERRGGYYLNIEPGSSIAGGGFYAPNPEDLMRIRKEFEYDDTEIRKIVSAPMFKKYFGGLQGESVKSAPRGFSKEHPAIDLIRKKQFYVLHKFSDKEVTAPDFIENIVATYKGVRPFFDYMSLVLTTNLNGESII